ncbi:MAG: MFS transporter [Elusimicrobia bacterium CG08_land_8_20_14_0_20_59_10]|nr:MAG: MFS transporter [Elusimicrobia bacterium CG08_land_8_20_14_0_20_59_10]
MNDPGRHSRASTLDLTLRAFKYRNYRLFFGGQCISLVGTWMQMVALSWLVYRLTGSTVLLGVTGFANQIPSLLLAPFTGVAADRFDRRKILLFTQALAMTQALALALLVLYGSPQIWQIISLAVMLGVVNAFDMPARQAFVIELVEKKEDLPNAIALNSSMFNSARLVGPSIAGLLIAAFGEGICFLLNALSYLVVIAALLAIRPPRSRRGAAQKKDAGGFIEGLWYAFSYAPIRYIIMMMAAGSLLGMPYTVLMPAYVKEILHGGPETLGFLMASAGCGALLGALRLAGRRYPAGLERGIPLFTGIFGCGLLAFSFSTVFALSAVLIAAASFGMISFMASANTVVQTLVDDDKRGRVMSLYGVAFMGMAPFGSLLAGWAASRLGVAYTIALSGALVLAATAFFISRLDRITAHAAPVYSRLGLLEIAAEDIREASDAGRTL